MVLGDSVELLREGGYRDVLRSLEVLPFEGNDSLLTELKMHHP